MPPTPPTNWAKAATDEITDDGWRVVVIDPDVHYPIAIDEIRAKLAAKTPPPTHRFVGLDKDGEQIIVQNALVLEYYAAVAVGDAAFAALPTSTRPDRARALDVVRRWATEQIHQAIGGTLMVVRITNRPAWKD